MPEDYYSDSPPSPTTPPPAPEQEMPTDRQTFLVPKSACPGMNVGDELKARITAVHENEYEMVYTPDEEGSSESMAESPEESPAPGEEMYA